MHIYICLLGCGLRLYIVSGQGDMGGGGAGSF